MLQEFVLNYEADYHFSFSLVLGSKGGAVVRGLSSHQSGLGSNPGVDAIFGLSLLLVLSFAPRGFGYSGLPLSLKTNTSKFDLEWTHFNEFS